MITIIHWLGFQVLQQVTLPLLCLLRQGLAMWPKWTWNFKLYCTSVYAHQAGHGSAQFTVKKKINKIDYIGIMCLCFFIGQTFYYAFSKVIKRN